MSSGSPKVSCVSVCVVQAPKALADFAGDLSGVAREIVGAGKHFGGALDLEDCGVSGAGPGLDVEVLSKMLVDKASLTPPPPLTRARRAPHQPCLEL